MISKKTDILIRNLGQTLIYSRSYIILYAYIFSQLWYILFYVVSFYVSVLLGFIGEKLIKVNRSTRFSLGIGPSRNVMQAFQVIFDWYNLDLYWNHEDRTENRDAINKIIDNKRKNQKVLKDCETFYS